MNMNIWENSYFDGTKDINIIVENKKYKLNSMVMFTSDFIRHMFNEKFNDSKNKTIEIYDVDTNTWELYINYIYGSILKCMKKYTGIKVKTLKFDNITIKDLISLMVFSDKMMVQSIGYEISEFLWNEYFDKYFYIKNPKINENILPYLTYDFLKQKMDIPENDGFSDPDFDPYSDIETVPFYYLYNKKWRFHLGYSFSFDKYINYPLLLYYFFVLLSYYNFVDRFISFNIILDEDENELGSRRYTIQELAELIDNSSMSLKDEDYDMLVSAKNMKDPKGGFINNKKKYKKNHKKFAYLADILLTNIFSSIVDKYIDTLSIIYKDNIRIPCDDLIHKLIQEKI